MSRMTDQTDDSTRKFHSDAHFVKSNRKSLNLIDQSGICYIRCVPVQIVRMFQNFGCFAVLSEEICRYFCDDRCFFESYGMTYLEMI